MLSGENEHGYNGKQKYITYPLWRCLLHLYSLWCHSQFHTSVMNKNNSKVKR